jgi:hypothetical protein
MDSGSRAGAPFIDKRKIVLILSIVAAVLMALLSLAGLIWPDSIYPDDALRETSIPNDLVNLCLGLPLFFYIWRKLKSQLLLGWLLLPGFLIFVIYNYLAYVLSRPPDWFAVLEILLVALSVYTLARLLSSLDHSGIKDQLESEVPVKFSAWVLLVFGAAFITLAVSQISAGIAAGTIPPLGNNAVAVADILVSVGWILGGYLLLRESPLGYSVGLGLLVAASFLFLGLILFFFLAPLLVGRPFDWIEVVTVLIMGMIAFIPTGIYWSGVVKSETAKS